MESSISQSRLFETVGMKISILGSRTARRLPTNHRKGSRLLIATISTSETWTPLLSSARLAEIDSKGRHSHQCSRRQVLNKKHSMKHKSRYLNEFFQIILKVFIGPLLTMPGTTENEHSFASFSSKRWLFSLQYPRTLRTMISKIYFSFLGRTCEF